MFLTEKFKSAIIDSLEISNDSPTIELIVPPDEKIAICSLFLVWLNIAFNAFLTLDLKLSHGIIPLTVISLLTHLCKNYLKPNIRFVILFFESFSTSLNKFFKNVSFSSIFGNSDFIASVA